MKELDFDKLRCVCEAAETIWHDVPPRLLPAFDGSIATTEFIATFNPTLVKQLLDLAQREYEKKK